MSTVNFYKNTGLLHDVFIENHNQPHIVAQNVDDTIYKRENRMGNPGKITTIFEWYIHSLWKYDIKDNSGKHNLGLNIADAVLYAVYLALTVIVLWRDGISLLPFFATVILMIRSFIDYRKRHKQVKSGNNSVAIAFLVRESIYPIVILFAGVLYFSTTSDTFEKVLLSLCYSVFTVFELTDVLADCYDAVPQVYKGV